MVQTLVGRFGSAPKLSEPAEWLSDNGSSYIAHETRAFERDIGLVPRRTPYRSPQINRMAKSFVKTFKRDYVAIHAVSTAQSVLKAAADLVRRLQSRVPASSVEVSFA
jgi:putative transposase